MKKFGLLIAALILVGLGYLAGARRGAPPAGGDSGPAAAKEERKIAFYRSPMDPSIHSDHPTQDSMGMDFVPVYTDEVEAPAGIVRTEKRERPASIDASSPVISTFTAPGSRARAISVASLEGNTATPSD